ncbi:formyltransferase family protein [bacterium]|jgi:methionyl-tRNA formyltransferase|nr:formyltransferase family protein [bacterium]
MKIVFIGSVIFSKFLLKSLFKIKKITIVGVCTKNKSKFNSDFYNLGNLCKKKKIPYIYCKKINTPMTINWIKIKKPDYIFCFGWSELLSSSILKIPKKGSIGYHPSELPKNKGRNPIIWSLVLGLKFAGSSFFFMNKKPDSGKIISQQRIKIENKDNSNSLYKKLIKVSVKQLKILINKLDEKQFKNFKKGQIPKSNYWRKRNFDDGQVDWRMSAKNIYNLTRALSKPYPYSHFYFRGKKIEIIQTKIISFKKNNIEPGKVLAIKKKKLFVKCGKGAISIIKYKPNLNIKVNDYLI